ncbi:MAG: hypothetical protein C0401_11105 [Anaerolinea sp.]|nr:hypothetical protein [Anaerolinea sp.]
MTNPSLLPEASSVPAKESQDTLRSNIESLTSKTLRGLQWSYIDTIISAILQIGYTAIMARLLSPADFGLVAMGGVVLRFGSYFAQMGVGSALVQKKELAEEEIRAAFTSNVILGLLGYGLVWIAAPLVTYIFNNPALVSIVRTMALSFVLTGLSTTALSLLRRNLKFRSIAIIDIISFIAGYGCGGIILAFAGFGVWSLVAAALSQNALLAILAFLLTRHSLSFVYNWKYFGRLYSFGGRVSIISFMESISSNLDTLAIGHFVGEASLGIYNRAFMLVNLPMQYLVTSFSRVLMPSYSKIQSDIPRLRKNYLSSVMFVGSILIPVCWGIAAASREIVLLVLGEKWSAAIPLLRILAFATPLSLLSHLAGSLLEAKAELNVKILIQSVYIVFLSALFFFLSNLGVIGFAIAVVIGELGIHFSYIIATKRFLKIEAGEIFAAYKPAIFSGLIIGPLIYAVGLLLRQWEMPVWITFLMEVAGGGILLICLFIFSGPQRVLRREFRERVLDSGIMPNKNSVVGRIVNSFRIYISSD